MLELRPYQHQVIADFRREVEAGYRRILMVAPTGAGKTVIARAVIEQEVQNYKSVLVIAHRREIIAQTSSKLDGISHGIIQAGFSSRPLERVQVASIQTLHKRAIRGNTIDLPPADLLVVDEAHHAPARTYSEIIKAYPKAILLGLTATPCRGDGRGLGGIFERLIQCPQIPELIQQGYLVPTVVYAPYNPDLRGVRTRHGDYVEAELAERMDQAELVGDIVTHWVKFGEGRKTVCFAVNVAHSKHICLEFIEAGVRAEHIDGNTPKPERDATLSRLASGEIELVTNCMVLTEGWDLPDCSCEILARPTKKMGLYRQMIGRVLRPAPGKTNCIVLDHSGAVFRHGFAEDYVEWTLDPDRLAGNATHKRRGGDTPAGPRLLECVQCGAVRVGGESCSHCGYLPEAPARGIDFADGDLALVAGGRTTRPDHADAHVREDWHAMLAGYAAERRYKPAWVGYRYYDKFGIPPPSGARPAPREPSNEVRRWVKSRNIAFAKRRR